MKKKTTYVIGHKNPDTDSICSAIAYAKLKSDITGEEYIARRAGQINEETNFVLTYFETKIPKLLNNVKLQVRDMDIRKIEGIGPKVSIREAWNIMKEGDIKALPVVVDNELEGVVSTGDIARSYMEEYDSQALARARTQYRNIAKTLEGDVLTGNEHGFFLNGRVMVGASDEKKMKELIHPSDLVIIGNREEAFLCAVEIGASCIILCGDAIVNDEFLQAAKEKNIVVIRTSYDTFTTTRLINQSAPVRHYMSKGPLITFHLDDYVDDIKEVMASKKFRDFPILDKNGGFKGFVSRRRFMTASKKRVVLVDHNEKSQAVEGIEEAEILEIIDHHRIGNIETMNPVYFRNQPVGCTATIVAQMYQEAARVPDRRIAGLLCSAIISDTLMFRSPTCTAMDETACRELGKIAKIDIEDLAGQMFHAGSSMQGKSAKEIFDQDFKVFHVEENTFGVGQISSLNKEELQKIRDMLKPNLEETMKEKGLGQIYFMLTDILNEATEIICGGTGARLAIVDAFDIPEDAETMMLKGVVSRKKQLIPALVGVLQ